MPYFADFGTFQCLILQASRAARQWSLQAAVWQSRAARAKRQCLILQIFELSNALFCILRLLCEFIEGVEHYIAVDGIVPCLGAALLIDGAADVLDAVEDIKAVDNESELAVEETP